MSTVQVNDLISVIVPMYNAASFIEETLNSVLLQTYLNWECLIIDDGSTDNSALIVNRFIIKDKRFKYFKQNNAGPSVARNLGVSKSHGDYIQFLDADDVLLENRFEYLLENYHDYKQDTILGTSMLIGDNSNIYNTRIHTLYKKDPYCVTFKEMYQKFGNEYSFVPACILFPRKMITNIKWDSNLKHSEDWEYYLHVLHQNLNAHFYILPVNTVIYRDTDNSLSKQLDQLYQSNYIILQDYFKIKYLFPYINAVCFLSYRNFYNKFKKNAAKIHFPISISKKSDYCFYLLIPIIYMRLFIIFVHSITKVIINRLKK